MLLRVRQIPCLIGEPQAGWPAFGALGPVQYAWPATAQGFELLLMNEDGTDAPAAARSAWFRPLLGHICQSLQEKDRQLILRLDGPLESRELLPAFHQLTEEPGCPRFAVKAIRQLDGQPSVGSFRMQIHREALSRLAINDHVGLERLVRLRLMTLPEALVAPALDIDELDDERWRDVLGGVDFLLGFGRGMQSITLISRRWNMTELQQRLATAAARVADHAMA